MNFSIIIVNNTRDTCQCGKLICSWKRGSIGNAGKESRFSDWREPNHANSCISKSTNLKSFSLLTSFGWRLKKLRSVLSQFSFELTHMIFSSFVFLCSSNLVLDLFNLLCNTHSYYYISTFTSFSFSLLWLKCFRPLFWLFLWLFWVFPFRWRFKK